VWGGVKGETHQKEDPPLFEEGSYFQTFTSLLMLL
jgi:hypothetical protein